MIDHAMALWIVRVAARQWLLEHPDHAEAASVAQALVVTNPAGGQEIPRHESPEKA